MQIKRDYSQPFFSTRRRRRTTGSRFLFFYGLLIGGLLVVVYTQFDRLQLVALDAIGLAPTATPFASELATRGAEAFLRGDVNAAATAFEQAHAQQPQNLDYIYEYGKMLIELNRADEVLEPRANLEGMSLADWAIDLNPRDPRGYTLKTKALVWEGQAADAIPIGVSGLEQSTGFAPLYAALGRAYTSIGRYQQGLTYGEEAVRLDPLDIDAHRSYAYSLIWVGARDEAIRQLEDAIAINPNLTASYFELAAQYLASNQDEMAIATYERILALEPRNERAYLRLCESYNKVGQNDRAQGYCEDALNINPEYAPAWMRVGMARYTRRNYEGAIEAFNNCVTFGDSETPQIECWYLRGLAHYYLGQCDQAWTILTESLPMAEALPDNDLLIANIREGLRLTTVSCASYAGRPLPTDIPPTPIPPTPIGG
jgi:tetratricopeptide (TPR) repeat protein